MAPAEYVTSAGPSMPWTACTLRPSQAAPIPRTPGRRGRLAGASGAAPAEFVADKGYHGRAVLKDLDGGRWKTRISEPKRRHLLRWRGNDQARRRPGPAPGYDAALSARGQIRTIPGSTAEHAGANRRSMELNSL